MAGLIPSIPSGSPGPSAARGDRVGTNGLHWRRQRHEPIGGSGLKPNHFLLSPPQFTVKEKQVAESKESTFRGH